MKPLDICLMKKTMIMNKQYHNHFIVLCVWHVTLETDSDEEMIT